MSIPLFVSISTLTLLNGIHMTMTPMQPLDQPTGFIFDSMDFAMSRSSACLIQSCPTTPTMEGWDEETDENERDDDTENQVSKEEVAVEIDTDLHDDDEDEEQSHDEEEDEVYSDDDEFEQYLHGDDDD